MKKCQVHVRLVHRLPCQGWKSTLTQWHDVTHKPVVWPQPQVSHPEDSLPNFAGGCGSEVQYTPGGGQTILRSKNMGNISK